MNAIRHARRQTTRFPSTTIERYGRRLAIEHLDPAVATRFGAARHEAQVTSSGECRVVKRHRSLLAEAGNMPYAGLERLVVRAGQCAGIPIDVRRSNSLPQPLPPPNIAAARRLGRTDVGLMEFFRREQEGIIRYQRGRVDVAKLIAEAALAFPASTLAVMTASYPAAKKFHAKLRKNMPKAMLLSNRTAPGRTGRCVVGTFFSMAHGLVEIEKRDFLFVPDAENAWGQRAQVALLASDMRGRLFGFLPIEQKLTPYSRGRIMATFGPAELTIPRHSYEAVQVRVAWTPIRGGQPLAATANPVDIKRIGVWSHVVRNRRVARLAEALRLDQRVRLERDFAAVAEATRDFRRPKTVIVVESADHALAIAHALPEWRLVLDDNVHLAGLSRSQRETLANRRWAGESEIPLIASSVGLATATMAVPDVVIWAGAGMYPPELPVAWTMRSCSTNRELLVVDFVDRHHPDLTAWTRSRQRACVAMGWLPPGVDPMEARIDRFLAGRGRQP